MALPPAQLRDIRAQVCGVFKPGGEAADLPMIERCLDRCMERYGAIQAHLQPSVPADNTAGT